MKYIFFLIAICALIESAWHVALNNQDAATHCALAAVVSMQMAIFWKRAPVYFRSIEFKRKPIVIRIPKIIAVHSNAKKI